MFYLRSMYVDNVLKSRYEVYLVMSMHQEETALHPKCDCKAFAYLRFCDLGYYFMETTDYFDTLIK
jgi:hypothetical protein